MIAITVTDHALVYQAQTIALRLSIPFVETVSADYAAMLVLTPMHLELRLTDRSAPGPVFVDFLAGALAHRRQYGGGRNQLIAKAVGVKAKEKPSVLDVTAGLGRDGFVLALLGCDVTLCERSPVIHALLSDGLQRGQAAGWFMQLSLQLIHANGLSYLSQVDKRPDVVYLDPMFPDKTKSALVKKEMRVLRTVVGDDPDASQLLAAARQVAIKRVVVKRAKLAPTLTDDLPDLVYKGKSSRFDVYLCGGASDRTKATGAQLARELER